MNKLKSQWTWQVCHAFPAQIDKSCRWNIIDTNGIPLFSLYLQFHGFSLLISLLACSKFSDDDVKNVVVDPQDIVPDCLMPEASATTNSNIRMENFQTSQSSASDTSQNCDQPSYYEKPNADLTANIGPSRRTRKQKMDQLCDQDILLAQLQMQQAQLSIENLRLERKTLQERYQQQREAHEWQRAQHEANLNLAMLQIKFWEKKTGYGDMET